MSTRTLTLAAALAASLAAAGGAQADQWSPAMIARAEAGITQSLEEAYWRCRWFRGDAPLCEAYLREIPAAIAAWRRRELGGQR